MKWKVVYILAMVFPIGAQDSAVTLGARSFETRCSVCHGGDGNGNERTPGIVGFVESNSDQQVAAVIRRFAIKLDGVRCNLNTEPCRRPPAQFPIEGYPRNEHRGEEIGH